MSPESSTTLATILAWIGPIGAIIAIVIALTKRKPEINNLNAGTIQTLSESIDLLSKRVGILETEVSNYKVWTNMLLKQMKRHDIEPISMAEALRQAGKS